MRLAGYLGDSPAAPTAWEKLIGAIDREMARADRLAPVLEKLAQSGAMPTPVERWSLSLGSLFQLLEDLIGTVPTVQNAIDKVLSLVPGSSASTTAMQGVQYGAWEGQLAGFSGLADGLGNPLLLARSVGAFLANRTVWLAIKDVLLKLGPLVAGVVISSNVSKSVDSLAGSAAARGDAMERCLTAAAELSTPEAQRAAVERCGQQDGQLPLMWLLLGGAAGIGTWLYLRQKRVF